MFRDLVDAVVLVAKHQLDPRRASILPDEDRATSPVLSHAVTRIDGTQTTLAEYRGKVLLIVNTASKCGFTKQYDALQALWKEYGDRGLVVLGFPCDDFGHQEPGTSDEIVDFCRINFGVDFPLFDKVHVRGEEQHPLFHTLCDETPTAIRGDIRWNFTKFLVDKEGRAVARFEPKVTPDAAELKGAIEVLLEGPA
jgi:glutathione peroxidase